MPRSILQRLYRARPLASVAMSLPGVLLVLWYAWSSFSRVDHYRRAVDAKAPLELETLHIALNDQLQGDIRRMLMNPPPEPSQLPEYRLRLTQHDYDLLLDGAQQADARPYVEAKVEQGERLLNAEVRIRGSRHWHTLGPQRSLKVKLDKGELLDGQRIFNLINDPTPMVIAEQLILDLAQEAGILTQVSRYVRVKINAKDFGVYRYETAADESLLRSSSRMPGSIYASELPAAASTEQLWTNTHYWTKVSSRTDSEVDKADFTDLLRFLGHVHDSTNQQFADFAQHELDLETFARLDALDVAFGGDQRDFRENHTYYFDPYRGRWEPIAGESRGFREDPSFNLVDNPVLIRLKMLPSYLSLRNRLLYDFLTGKGSPAALHARARRLLAQLAPELRTDPYWDAYRQLPRVDAFHRRMLRPNSLGRLALVVESELTTYGHRHAQLVAELEKNPLYIAVGEPVVRRDAKLAEPLFATSLSLVIDGHAGVGFNELTVTFGADCVAPSARLMRGGRELATRGRAGQIKLADELSLYPSVGLMPQHDPNPRRGHVRADELPIEYSLELVSSCRPEGVVARGRHLATDSRVVSRPVCAALAARLPKARLNGDNVPKFEASEVAPHPWELDAAAPIAVTLGPGNISLPSTRIFGPNETVTIMPGSRLHLGPGVSLIFLGRVTFDGQQHDRIEVLPLGSAPFGGIAIQGPHTSGSRLSYVSIGGGTQPSWRSVQYPGMIDVHDTHDVMIEGCRFGNNGGETDTLHVAYVKRLDVRDTSFLKVPEDAFDLEYTTADLRGLRVSNAGDDAFDLMGSQVRLGDSIILGSEGNGISAGEGSDVNVENTLIATSKVGVLVKNASKVALSGSVLFRNGTGVRTYQRTVRYAGDSEVTANVLFVAESTRDAVKRDDRKTHTLDRGRVLLDLPRRGVLDHVLESVLELSDWQDLPRWLGDQKEQTIP